MLDDQFARSDLEYLAQALLNERDGSSWKIGVAQ